ncbi:MAG: filamentous hemagglutinin N-terminal domain-containing protein [Rivularia sp. (in: Bacteria)]|nr:filamentous hemagglutinin N-terminal domain-containing protein [Rivularia sp. MS3]
MVKPASTLFYFATVLFSFFSYCLSATAQVSEDNSLGTTVKSNLSGIDFIIENGSRRGNNLFHSFKEFSIPSAGSVFFDNSTDISNIINRVTGGEISNINGVIRTNGNANLFLINPNGIIFGENALLDIGGSFLGTTAESLEFTDGKIFSAVDVSNSPILSINVPLGLQYGSNSGRIINRSIAKDSNNNTVGLQVNSGKTLGLIAGDILFETGYITTFGGNVKIASVDNGFVSISNVNEGWDFDFGQVEDFHNIQFQNALIKSDNNHDDSIHIVGEDIALTNNTKLISQNFADKNGGNILIKGNSILFDGDVGILNNGFSSKGNAGSILIEAADSIVSQNRNIISSSAKSGNAGNIDLKAKLIRFNSGSGITNDSMNGSANAGIISLTANSILYENSYATSVSQTVGNGGEINFIADNIQIKSSGFNVNNHGDGDGGKINFKGENIEIKLSGLEANSKGKGNAGEINLTGKNILVEQVGINSNTFNRGNGGKINLMGDSITIRQAGIAANSEGEGNAGEIHIKGNSFLLEQAGISSETFSSGRAGIINIFSDNVLLRKSGLSSRSYDDGYGGVININSRNFAIDSASINNDVYGKGDAGGVNIVSDNIRFYEALVSSTTEAEGNGGKINITAKYFEVENSGIASDTYGSGKGGEINIDSNQVAILKEAGIRAKSQVGATGNAGEINITGNDIFMEKDSEISTVARPNSSGNAGKINIVAESLELRDDNEIASFAEGTGNGGEIKIKADSLSLNNQSKIDTQTFNQGDAGKLILHLEKLQLNNNSSLNIRSNGTGNAGILDLNSNSIELDNQSSITAATLNSGDGGILNINANDILLNNKSQITTNTQGSGQGGKLILNTKNLNITQSRITAFTSNTGNAGNLNIKAQNINLTNGGGISTEVKPDARGMGGDLAIATSSLSVTDNSEITASSAGIGNAGSIKIDAKKVLIADSKLGAFSQTQAFAGAVNLSTETLEVIDNAQISVSSFGSGNAGNLELTADYITLNNQSKLKAETASGNGGNIKLRSSKILLSRNNSLISAQAGGTGDGGNIYIDSGLIISLKNSDIIANAFNGNGGQIKITTEGIIGARFRNQVTELSDITASSQFGVDGTVKIQNPNVNTNLTSIELPSQIIDSEQHISTSCRATSKNQFSVIGRGGLPSNPFKTLRGQRLWTDLRTNSHRSQQITKAPTANKKSSSIVEATGFVANKQGEIFLVADKRKYNQQATRNPQTCAELSHLEDS